MPFAGPLLLYFHAAFQPRSPIFGAMIPLGLLKRIYEKDVGFYEYTPMSHYMKKTRCLTLVFNCVKE
jgi:hypothetical protein